MSVADVTAWMPAPMEQADKAYYASLYPDDPHRCAAEAWEAWAVSQENEAGQVVRVNTGSQSIEYGQHVATRSAFDRASWHRARSRVRTVEVGPTLTFGYLDASEQVVETYPLEPRPMPRGE